NTRESLNAFNPSFVLELTATPNARHHISNVLVDVSGMDLKDEQMIKLPINIINTRNTDWHSTLTQAHAKRQELEQLALGVQQSDGRYIRPILVVRVERTGKDQRDGRKIHADDAKEYLMKNLSVDEKEIRIKSSEKDELGSEDLLDPLCPVRFIITKEALQEGWDCPFAYVLALLDKTTASTAMTQMVGRILRQPETRATSVAAMNECYVFCYDQDVKDAVEHVRKGLEEEGMTGLGEFVRAVGADAGDQPEAAEIITIKRGDKFKELRVFLPRVLHAEGDGWREINYETDILSSIRWDSLRYDPALFLDGKDSPTTTTTRVDVAKKHDLIDAQQSLDLTVETRQAEVWIEKRIDISFLARQLTEVIPNPWQATRIVEDALAALRAKGQQDDALFNNRLFLIDSIKRYLKQVVHDQSEVIFREKLAKGQITFRLVTNGNERLNFEIARELKQLASKQDRKLVRKDNTLIQNNLFEFVFEKEFNSLEKDFALYLADDEAVAWWHRMVARQDYSLQGWQRNKIYPDFVACVNGDRMLVLETKGLQLKGNDDTEYKQKLLSLLTEYHHALPAGEIALTKSKKQSITLAMLMEDSWRDVYGGLKKTNP
ncbi:MAG: restriction endonuclease subunit R, partial [Alphaproteobacteria bacterium]